MSEKERPKKVREQPLTYEDYANLPDDGLRYELADGVLELMSPGPSTDHQLVSFEIIKKLIPPCQNDYVIIHAPLDVILSSIEVRQPDIIMVHRSRMEIIKKHGIVGAPDLIVEILSPSSIRRDKVKKLKAYARYQVPEYWIVDPANGSLEQYLLRDHAYELTEVYQGAEEIRSDRISCISFTMEQIMQEIPDLPD